MPATLAHAPYGTIVGPNGQVLACPRWAPAPDVIDARLEALKRNFFLVRIAGSDGLGELWRCRRCRGKHPYLSLNCVERPFSGLDQVLYVIWQQAGDLAAVKSVSPEQAARHNAGRAIARQVVDDIPDLATSHPEMARRRALDGRMAAFDLDVGGLVVGRAEPIPPTLAQRYLDRINALRQSGGKLAIDGLEIN